MHPNLPIYLLSVALVVALSGALWALVAAFLEAWIGNGSPTKPDRIPTKPDRN